MTDTRQLKDHFTLMQIICANVHAVVFASALTLMQTEIFVAITHANVHGRSICK